MATTKLNVDQIGHCRQGSDIDLQAIFQGNISGKRSEGVKVNPVFQDCSHSDTDKTTEDSRHESTCEIDIQVYKNIPSTEKNHCGDTGDNACLLSNQISKLQIEHLECTSPSYEKDLNEKQDEMQRDSLKVTNGDVCIGDIIIENGFRNPNCDVDDEMGVLNEVVNELQNLENIDSTSTPTVTEDSKHSHQNGTVVQRDKSDWPDIDEIVLPSNEDGEKSRVNRTIQNGTVCVNKHLPVLEVENVKNECDFAQGKSSKNTKSKSERKSSKKKLKERKNSLPDHILNSLSMRPAKPILIPTTGIYDEEINGDTRKLGNGITEQKSVKFSDDTVFNEHKPNKYKKERLNLRDIYQGKISNDNALAKANPIFVDDDGFEICLTDDEKASRYSTNNRLSNELNVPAYFKEYIINSDDLPPVTDSKHILGKGNLRNHDIESISSDLTVNSNYDRLISKTLAKERRSKIVRLTLASFAFLIVIGVVVLLVIYFGKPQKKS